MTKSPPRNSQSTLWELLEAEMPEAKQIKLVPITAREKVLIDDFLGHFECGIAFRLAQEVEMAKQLATDALKGQIEYHQKQVSTLKMLRGINWQRREAPTKRK